MDFIKFVEALEPWERIHLEEILGDKECITEDFLNHFKGEMPARLGNVLKHGFARRDIFKITTQEIIDARNIGRKGLAEFEQLKKEYRDASNKN